MNPFIPANQTTHSNPITPYRWFDTDRIPQTTGEVIESLDELLHWANQREAARALPQPVGASAIIFPAPAESTPDPTSRAVVFALKKKATAYINAYGKQSTLSASSEQQYRKKMNTLAKWRPNPHSPPEIERHVSTQASFYAYRAALIWNAIQGLKENKRILDRATDGSAEWDKAVMELKIALADLDAYPMDRKGDGILAYHEQQAWHAMGITDAPEVSTFTLAKKAGITKPPSSDKGKARYASKLNREKPDWRETIFSRLQAIQSPWLLHAAVASLSGCRPQELDGTRVTFLANGKVQFEIEGAKQSDQKGQPVRILTVHENSMEFEMLKQHCITHGDDNLSFTLKAHASLANPAEAFGAAVKRAGDTALGKAYHFSAYCYRHALASDLKADGIDREDLALVLGHAVTETSSCYGRHSGGRRNVRQIEAEGTRAVKVNHKADPKQKRVPQAQAPAGNNAGTHGNAPDSAVEFPVEPSSG